MIHRNTNGITRYFSLLIWLKTSQVTGQSKCYHLFLWNDRIAQMQRVRIYRNTEAHVEILVTKVSWRQWNHHLTFNIMIPPFLQALSYFHKMLFQLNPPLFLDAELKAQGPSVIELMNYHPFLKLCTNYPIHHSES